jgi:hypothetical protein
MTDQDKFTLPPREASQYLKTQYGISRAPKTLAKLRCVSTQGPVFKKAGRDVLYSPNSLDAFAEKLLSPPRSSTSNSEARAA